MLLPSAIWRALLRFRQGARLDAPVFASAATVDTCTVPRAGVELAVSPRWLRQAHANHVLDRGAPIHLVQATLGLACRCQPVVATDA